MPLVKEGTRKSVIEENISVGTWIVRTSRPAGNIELTHIIDRFHWSWKTLVKCQKMTDTRFISAEERTDKNSRLDVFTERNN